MNECVLRKKKNDRPSGLLFGGKRSTTAESACRPKLKIRPVSQPCLGNIFEQEPSEILPFLFIGSSKDANDSSILKRYRISHVLNVTRHLPNNVNVTGENYMRISIQDDFHSKLQPYLEESFQFIEQVRKSGGRLLCHCQAGISRSPAIVIAYLVRYLRLTVDESLSFVKARRPNVSPNFHFLGELIDFQKIIRDKQENYLFNFLQTTNTGSRRSWSFDDLFNIDQKALKRQTRLYSSVRRFRKDEISNVQNINVSREVLCI